MDNTRKTILDNTGKTGVDLWCFFCAVHSSSHLRYTAPSPPTPPQYPLFPQIQLTKSPLSKCPSKGKIPLGSLLLSSLLFHVVIAIFNSLDASLTLNTIEEEWQKLYTLSQQGI